MHFIIGRIYRLGLRENEKPGYYKFLWEIWWIMVSLIEIRVKKVEQILGGRWESVNPGLITENSSPELITVLRVEKIT